MAQSNRQAHVPRIHAYAASFGDDLAREIICASTKEGSTVLDPFVGAGTTALQALLLNRNAIGIDVDPIATRISRVLTGRLDISYLSAAAQHFSDRLETAQEWLVGNPASYRDLAPGKTFQVDSRHLKVPAEPAIAFWFDASHMATLAVARSLASQEPEELVRQFFEVAISSAIIRKWPNTLSFAMDIDHSRPHRPRNREAQPLEQQFALLRRIVRQALSAVAGLQQELGLYDVSAKICEGDVVEQLNLLPSACADFVLTSPPYLNAIDYPRAHKFSQWWLSPEHIPLSRSEYLGLRRGGRGVEVEESLPDLGLAKLVKLFAESKRYPEVVRYVLDLASVVSGLHRVTSPGSPIVFIVADNVLEGRVFPVSRIVASLFSQAGMVDVTIKKRSIKKTRRRYPFGINGFSSTMRDEYLVMGRR